MTAWRRAPDTTGARRRSARAGTGATEVFIAAVLAEHGAALSGYARKLCANDADAEDLVQETLIRAVRHPEALDGSAGSARGWLFTVARNLAVDAARRQSRATDALPRLVPAEAAGPRVDEAAERAVETAMMSLALESLSEDHREVLVQAVWNDLPASQIAADTGIPVGTVKSRIHYALKMLRLTLQEMGYQP